MFRRTNNRARQRIPTQWIPCDPSVFTVGASSLVTRTLVDASAGFTAGATGPAPAIARMTVMRIMGEVIIYSASATGVQPVVIGIAVVPSSSLAVFGTPDPALQATRDFDWLFLRTYVFNSATPNQPPTLLNNQTILPMGPRVDVKVKRRLEPDHSLILSVSTNVSTSAAVTVHPWLRTLIGRVA